MRSIVYVCALTTLALTSVPASAQEVMARVLSSTAVMQQVAVPRQVCTTQPVIQQSQPSGAGAVMGAIAGGAVGNAVGGGSGRDLATVIGIVGGAVLGNRIEGTRDEVRNVQQCTTQTTFENRILHYDVIYEYDGKRYSVKMPNDPGQFVRLQLNPVGTIPAAPTSTTTIITSPISSAPVYPVVTAAPVYITQAHPAPVHVQVGGPFTFYPAARLAPVVPVDISLHWSRYNHPHRRWH
ncbi:MAG: glycine zipper 2TM domain-containing protein [Betaproteobacteria bacterium]